MQKVISQAISHHTAPSEGSRFNVSQLYFMLRVFIGRYASRFARYRYFFAAGFPVTSRRR